jgi:hypothetical protein
MLAAVVQCCLGPSSMLHCPVCVMWAKTLGTHIDSITLTVLGLETKLLMYQLWWWKRSRGRVTGTDWFQSLRSKRNTIPTHYEVVSVCCGKLTCANEPVLTDCRLSAIFWDQIERMETWGNCLRFWYGNCIKWVKICFELLVLLIWKFSYASRY